MESEIGGLAIEEAAAMVTKMTVMIERRVTGDQDHHQRQGKLEFISSTLPVWSDDVSKVITDVDWLLE